MIVSVDLDPTTARALDAAAGRAGQAPAAFLAEELARALGIRSCAGSRPHLWNHRDSRRSTAAMKRRLMQGWDDPAALRRRADFIEAKANAITNTTDD